MIARWHQRTTSGMTSKPSYEPAAEVTGQPSGEAARPAADVEDSAVGTQPTGLGQERPPALPLLGEVAGPGSEAQPPRRLERIAAPRRRVAGVRGREPKPLRTPTEIRALEPER